MIDEENQKLVQITSQMDTKKIIKSLNHDILKKYKNFEFIFLFLTNDKIIKFKKEIDFKYVKFNPSNLWNLATILAKN